MNIPDQKWGENERETQRDTKRDTKWDLFWIGKLFDLDVQLKFALL